MSRLMDRRRHHLAFKLNEFNRSKTYWHGTTKDAVPRIIRNGLNKQGIESYEEGDIAPLDGRVYVTQSLFQAIGYSLARSSTYGPTVYVFKIPGRNLVNDVLIDEDFIENVMLTGKSQEDTTFDLAIPFTQREDDGGVIEELREFCRESYKPLDATAKDVTRSIPDDLAQRVIAMYPMALASEGVVHPTELYTITLPQKFVNTDKEFSPEMLEEMWPDTKVEVTKLTPNGGHTGSAEKPESIEFHGLPIVVENPKGSTRSGVSPEGEPWSREVTADYGSIKRTLGADDEELDVWIGEDRDSEYVLVINQCDSDGDFDEHKIVLGCGSSDEAVSLYLSNYPDDWDGILSTKEMSWTEFLDWLDQDPTAFKKVAKKTKSNPAYDEESKSINESKKTPRAKKPHRFKPAEFTFPNGHPRCLICGDEETEGGMCSGRGKTASSDVGLYGNYISGGYKGHINNLCPRCGGRTRCKCMSAHHPEGGIPETHEVCYECSHVPDRVAAKKELSATERLAPLEVLDIKKVLGSELEELVEIAFENAVKCHPYAVDKEKADEAFYETLGSSLAVGIDEKYPSKEASEIYQRFRDVGIIL